MEVTFSEERDELGRSVRRFLEDKSPVSEVRRLMETPDGFDPEVWSQMATQLGLQGLVIPEEYGGSGFGYEELAVVFEEMGRALLCAPFFSTVALAVSALIASSDSAAMATYLPAIASGEKTATLAHSEGATGWELENIETRAVVDAGKWSISGTKSFVIDGATADVLLVVAEGGAGLSLFAVERTAPGVSVTPLSTLDTTRKQAMIVFENASGVLIGGEGEAASWLEHAFEIAATLLAAEEIGGAERVTEMSVEYAKHRIQYGRIIGTYQAIKHKCADMFVAVETAKSASYYARWAAAADSDELAVASSLAKSYCSEAYLRCAAQNIQIHGGIGFTWEHDAHLFFKRAKSSEQLLGSPAYHRERLARRVGM